MKKYVCLLSLTFLLTSCVDDVKFNNPAFQTLKDKVFWRAQSYKAYIGPNGGLVIEGSLGFEKVIIETASPTEQTFTLGINNVSKAFYSNTLPTETVRFYTGTNIGNGQIVITEYNIENNTVSGTFKFNAINSDATNTENSKVVFTEGVFYKVPLEVVFWN